MTESTTLIGIGIGLIISTLAYIAFKTRSKGTTSPSTTEALRKGFKHSQTLSDLERQRRGARAALDEYERQRDAFLKRVEELRAKGGDNE